ncbi:MAG: hypothetical protein ACREC3_06320 [Methyloceanibacter sp.]
MFNGLRFRLDIAPRIAQFVRTHDQRTAFIQSIPTREGTATAPLNPRRLIHSYTGAGRGRRFLSRPLGLPS